MTADSLEALEHFHPDDHLRFFNTDAVKGKDGVSYWRVIRE